MKIPALNSRSFEREISGCQGFERGRPENVLFFSDETLKRVATGSTDEFSSESKLHARAELLFRYLLSPDRKSEVGALLSKWIGSDALVKLHDQCICYASGGTDNDCDSVFLPLSSEEHVGEKDVKAIQNAIKPYLKADGIIPVIQGDKSWLLPFWFEARHGDPSVFDAEHIVQGEWSGYLSELKEITDDVVVGFRSSGGIVATGDSMMLPILMAWWRKKGDIPHYRPLRFMATGSLHKGFLGDVVVGEKGEKISHDIEGGFLVKPGVGSKAGEIGVGTDIENIKTKVGQWAEEQTICDASYAIKRIEKFEIIVRQTNSADWASVNKRLDNISERVKKRVEPDAWLDFLMLKSAARCHAGRTVDAFELNREARDFAATNVKFANRLLRLEIENLVILLDFENFGSLIEEAKGLEPRIEKYIEEHAQSDVGRDLMMRFSGTMGQVYAYAALRDESEDFWKKSKAYFDKAVLMAQELSGACEPGSVAKCRRLGDLAQDANYLYLWGELSGDKGASGFGVDAADCASALTDGAYGQDGKKCASKNEYFRQRIGALGAYLRMLKGEWDEKIVPDVKKTVDNAYFWVAATTAKYLGALYARKGDAKQAQEFLKRADEKMEEGRKLEDGHVLRIIHMTILAEGYRSLRSLGSEYAAMAEKMREKALKMFNSADSTSWGKGDWQNWLNSAGSDASFPGSRFWF